MFFAKDGARNKEPRSKQRGIEGSRCRPCAGPSRGARRLPAARRLMQLAHGATVPVPAFQAPLRTIGKQVVACQSDDVLLTGMAWRALKLFDYDREKLAKNRSGALSLRLLSEPVCAVDSRHAAGFPGAGRLWRDARQRCLAGASLHRAEPPFAGGLSFRGLEGGPCARRASPRFERSLPREEKSRLGQDLDWRQGADGPDSRPRREGSRHHPELYPLRASRSSTSRARALFTRRISSRSSSTGALRN